VDQQQNEQAIPQDELSRIAAMAARVSTSQQEATAAPKRDIRGGFRRLLREIVDDVIEDAIDPF